MPSERFQAAAARGTLVRESIALGARLTTDLPPFLRQPVTVEAARARLQGELARRPERFLQVVARAVYRRPNSPYRWLLQQAGCEYGDLVALVAREGLEGALRHLADRGVYVDFDEFKGRREIVRGSARLACTDRDFDNLLARSHYLSATGGSRGRATWVHKSLGNANDMAVSFALVQKAYGIHQPQHLFWIGPSPAWALVHLGLGDDIDAWFYPVHPLPAVARFGQAYLRLLSRLGGRRVPPLVFCDVQQPERIAAWIATHRDGQRPVLVNTVASSAVRIAAAAASAGQSLAGVTFHTRSEPLTPARRRIIEQAGARVLADYASVELSGIAYGCATATHADDLHFSSNRYAVVERERPVVAGGPTVDAMLLTTLSPDGAKVAINTELGDAARIEQRDCDCLLGSLGLRTHLSEVRSFEKLSTEGTTFARTNIVQILEDILPARFGGIALDYQLVEEERADGATSLVLRVHPSIGEIDEAAVCDALLDEMGRGNLVDEYQATLIRRAQSVIIRRLPPIATGAGKVLPFHLQRASE